MTLPKIAETKNQWLYQQVDVEFPTKESIAGLEVYKKAVATRQYQTLTEAPQQDGTFTSDEIYLVDFHRLTVMFALLQSSMWQSESDQQMIVEFLTQIIYSTPCSLYLGFKQGEAVSAAIVTREEQTVLISDIAIKSDFDSVTKQYFVAGLCDKLELKVDESHPLVIEQ